MGVGGSMAAALPIWMGLTMEKMLRVMMELFGTFTRETTEVSSHRKWWSENEVKGD